MKQNKRALRMEIKQLTDLGSFEGVLATYGNVDLGGDLIERGAFTKTIQEHGNEVKLLWQHEPGSVIGTLKLLDEPDALRVKGQIEIDDDIPFSRTAYKLLKKQLLTGLSIGYDTIKSDIKDGVRHLKELRLWEGSLVTFPMNEYAAVSSIKAYQRSRSRKDNFDDEFAQTQIIAAPYQMMDAIYSSLSDMLYDSDLSRDDRMAGSTLALEQFSNAWMAWLPQFLDLIDLANADSEMPGMMPGMMQRAALELKKRIVRATKEGRRLSTATKSNLKEAHGNIKSADSILTALLLDEAEADEEENDDDTSDEKAAYRKPEPVTHHSGGIETQIKLIRALIPSA
jgi:HK97 family phage prohead protease